MIDLPGPVAVVAHDAGAANHIFAWIANSPDCKVRACLAGPAKQLWQARFPDRPLQPDIERAIATARSVLSGTGWASDLEHRARTKARDQGILSVAVLDHWVNYRSRFTSDGKEVLPDRVWVVDGEAQSRAVAAIPGIPVELRQNAYLAEQVAAAGPVPADGDLLFLSEPARSYWGGCEPGEFQALDFLMAHVGGSVIPSGLPIRMRPHPSDAVGKYDAWLADHPAVTIDTSSDVAAALEGARLVAGMNSAALQIALASGRTTICALPPNAPACVLPLTGLVHLRDEKTVS